MDQKVRWHLARCLAATLNSLFDVRSDQSRQHILKVFMKQGMTPGINRPIAATNMLISMLLELVEDGKAKPNDPFIRLRRIRHLR